MKIIRSDKVKYYSKNKFNENLNKSCESTNIILHESNFYNSDNSLNKSFTPPKSKPELVTVKLFPSPKKCKISYVEIENGDETKEDISINEKQNQIAIELKNKDEKQNTDGKSKKIINIKINVTKTKNKDRDQEESDLCEYIKNNDFFTHENCGKLFQNEEPTFLEKLDDKFEDETGKIVETTDLDNLDYLKELTLPRDSNTGIPIIQTTDLDNLSRKSYFAPEVQCPNNSKTGLELSNEKSFYDSSENYYSKYINKGVQTTDLDEIFPKEKEKCIFEENQQRPLSPIEVLVTKEDRGTEKEINPLHSTQHDFSSINETGRSSLIFLPDKNQPLSPIQNETSNTSFDAKTSFLSGRTSFRNEPETSFPKVQHLISFHESLVNQDNRRHSLPIMGRARLMEKIECTDQSKLNDSEIIHELVHDRFIVNAYKNRSFKKPPKKPARFGKIYRSLERRLRTQEEKHKLSITIHDILPLESSSPISTPLRSNFEVSQSELEHNYSRISEENEKEIESLTEDEEIVNKEIVPKVIIANKFHEIEVQEKVPSSKKSSSQNINRYSSSTVFDEMPDNNQNLSYSAFDSEYGSASQFSENYCNSTDDFSSFSGYFTPATFKNYENKSTLPNKLKEVRNEKLEEGEHRREDKSRENTLGNELSYDMEEFLKKALGDELNEDVSSFIGQVSL